MLSVASTAYGTCALERSTLPSSVASCSKRPVSPGIPWRLLPLRLRPLYYHQLHFGRNGLYDHALLTVLGLLGPHIETTNRNVTSSVSNDLTHP